MTRNIILVCILVITSVQSHKVNLPNLLDAIQTCKAMKQIDTDILGLIMRMETPKLEYARCAIACTFKKLGLMHENNTILVNEVIPVLKLFEIPLNTGQINSIVRHCAGKNFKLRSMILNPGYDNFESEPGSENGSNNGSREIDYSENSSNDNSTSKPDSKNGSNDGSREIDYRENNFYDNSTSKPDSKNGSNNESCEIDYSENSSNDNSNSNCKNGSNSGSCEIDYSENSSNDNSTSKPDSKNGSNNGSRKIDYSENSSNKNKTYENSSNGSPVSFIKRKKMSIIESMPRRKKETKNKAAKPSPECEKIATFFICFNIIRDEWGYL